MTAAPDELERLERVIDDLRDELATTRHDVETVKAAQERGSKQGGAGYSKKARYKYDRGDSPQVRASREWFRSGGARGVRESVGWGDEPSRVAGLRWAAHPFKLRFSRGFYGVRNRVRRRFVTVVIWLVVLGVAAIVWGPSAPWMRDLPKVCGQDDGEQSVAAKVTAAEPAAVKIPKTIGRTIRGLAGPPPDVRKSQERAARAGRAAAVSLLALKASIRGEKDPAQVSAYTSSYRAQRSAEVVTAAGSCIPPSCPTTGSGGPVTVAFRPAGADPEAERVTRAAAVAAGATGRNLEIAMRLAWKESQFKATARNPRPPHATGVWQVAQDSHQDDPEIGQWADPFANARMMRRISKDFTDWSPWSTWPAVQREMAAAGASSTPAQPAGLGRPDDPCDDAAPSSYSTGSGMAWGPEGGPVYRNGEIPASALAHPRSAPRHLLRADAAAALDRLSAAYQARFGKPLGVTDSYRDLAGQRSVYARKPGLAAVPGTSNHGWARALDLVVGGYGSTDYLWLRENAPRFGWDNPEWARGQGSKDEPWHWEFTPTGAQA